MRATFSGVHVQSAAPQIPASDSFEHARYGFSVSYAIPVPVAFEIWWIHCMCAEGGKG